MLDYKDAVILAPMVRVGTLPMRLLALEYGADIVYTEEIIDFKILKCRRVVNDVLGTIDFVDDTEDVVVFRTCSKEKDRVVFQLGTCDPDRALKAVKVIENDVASIDINMGCPKEFSIKGGMGAALLSKPELVEKILKTLIKNSSKPITCKIRILPDLNATIGLCKLIAKTGVAALAVHGRTKDERSRHPNHNNVIREIAKCLQIPVIANGGSREIFAYEDIEKFRTDTGATAVMIARAAQWNCSVLRKEGMLPMDDVIVSLLKNAVDYDNHPLNTKYCIQQMLQDLQETPKGRCLLAAKTLEEICKLWDVHEYYLTKQAELKSRSEKLRRIHSISESDEDSNCQKRLRTGDVIEMEVNFIRKRYTDAQLPKTILHAQSIKKKWPPPKYLTEHRDKLFKSVAVINEVKYTTTTWLKNKKNAEQAAALACLEHLETSIQSLEGSKTEEPIVKQNGNESLTNV